MREPEEARLNVCIFFNTDSVDFDARKLEEAKQMIEDIIALRVNSTGQTNSG